MKRRSTEIWVIAALLIVFSLGEARLFDRLLYEGRHGDPDFVLANVKGILEGRPVSPSWQQRLLAPTAVMALARLGLTPLESLRLFGDAMVFAANGLLFLLVRRRGGSVANGWRVVVLWALAHALLMYALEYPWDEVDILLFLAFGAWAARGGSLLRWSPLLLVGALNHETILYVPLWYLIAPLERSRLGARVKQDVM